MAPLRSRFLAGKLHCLLLFLIEFILLASFYYCNTGENINIRTVKDLKAYLDDKIDKVASSESISDIKVLVQEQSNLILELTETVNSQKERIDKLEESLNECENSWKSPKQCLLI